MKWNGGENWLPRQINVLGTTFVKDSKWFGWWKMVKMAKSWMRSGGSELTVFERVLGYFLCEWMMNDSFSSSPPNQLPLASLFPSFQLATIALLSSFIQSQGQRKTCLHLSQKMSFQFQQSICYPKAIWWLNWQCRQLIFELHHSKWWLSGGGPAVLPPLVMVICRKSGGGSMKVFSPAKF